MDYSHTRNDLQPEIASIHSLVPFFDTNAPARCVMFGSHFSQRPVIEGSEPSPIVTGIESEFGKYTFNVRMPEDGTIVMMIPKYPPVEGSDINNWNSETLVIYRSHKTDQYGCFTIPYYCSHDSVFGFRYELNENTDSLNVGASFKEGTIFADTPANKKGHYTFSRNLNLCYMSHPNVGLDGYVISRDVLPFFKFKLYEKRVIEFGQNSFPLNLYGDDDNYKPFPDVGEWVKRSGLLACTRRYDPIMAPSNTSVKDCQRVDYQFDEPVFARAGEGKVIDITVIENPNFIDDLPPQMSTQVKKYSNYCKHYYQSLLRFYHKLQLEYRKADGTTYVPLTEELHNQIVYAYAYTRQQGPIKQEVTLTYKKEPLDLYRVEFTVEYIVTPSIGYKLSCQNGGKGVICRIEEPENMPVDSDGNRADIITGPDSVPGRMNLGRMYTPYICAAARDIRRSMLEDLGLGRWYSGKLTDQQYLAIPEANRNNAISKMLLYYDIVSPRSKSEYLGNLNDQERVEWMLNIINDKLYTYIPLDDRRDLPEMVELIEKNFKLTYGPVTYIGHSGKKVTTKHNVRIAPIPIMLLDKIADGWLATDTGKYSNFGILAARTKADKNRRPWKNSPSKVVGETEGRIYACYGGRHFIAELMDRNGNLVTQREIAKRILEAPEPFAIKQLVDRTKIPFGETRSLQIFNQFLFCLGVKTVYTKETL